MPLPQPRLGPFAFDSAFTHWEWLERFGIPMPGVIPYVQDGVADIGALITPPRPGGPGVLLTESTFSTPGALIAARTQLAALVGTMISVVDEWGLSWPTVIVMPWRAYDEVPILVPEPRYQLQITWELIAGAPQVATR